MIQGGSGVTTREIIASSQGDIGIGDITDPIQLSNHGGAGPMLMPVDTRSSAVLFIIRKDLKDQGVNTLEALTEWKTSRRSQAGCLGFVAGVPITYGPRITLKIVGLDQKVT